MWSIENDVLIQKDGCVLQNILLIGEDAKGPLSFVEQLLTSLLLTKRPDELKLIFANFENSSLKKFGALQKTFIATIPHGPAVSSSIEECTQLIESIGTEMQNRFTLLKEAGVSNIQAYNKKFAEHQLDVSKGHQKFPYLYLILTDLSLLLKADDLLYFDLFNIINDGYKVGLFSIMTTTPTSDNMFVLLSQEIQSKAIFKNDNRNESNERVSSPFYYMEAKKLRNGNLLGLDENGITVLIDFIATQKDVCPRYILPEYIQEVNFDEVVFDDEPGESEECG